MASLKTAAKKKEGKEKAEKARRHFPLTVEQKKKGTEQLGRGEVDLKQCSFLNG